MRELQDSHWWYRARSKIIIAVVGRFIRPGSKLLDFGAGSGGMAKEVSAAGYEIVVGDISEQGLAACRERNLDTLDLRTSWPEPGAFDCILACDVLEHVQDDVELLEKLRRALRAGGWLIATVPAYDFLWSGEDYVSEHVRRYGGSVLQRRIQKAGYSIRWSTHFNTLLFPLMVGAIMFARLFRPHQMYRSNVRPLPSWQNRVLYEVFAAERLILRCFSLPVGASILVVAQSQSVDSASNCR